MTSITLRAVRGWYRQPVLAALIVLPLALAIAATTVTLSVAYSLLFAPLPYRDVDQLVLVLARGTELCPGCPNSFSFSTFDTWKRQSSSFAHLAVYRSGSIALQQDSVVTLNVAYVSGEFFQTLGTPPLFGRVIDPADAARGERLAVLSARTWKRLYGTDKSAVGGSITLPGARPLVIGVMPDGFEYPVGTDVWLLLEQPLESPQRRVPNLAGIGRLMPSGSASQAETELRVIRERLLVAGSADSTPPAILRSVRQQLRAQNRSVLWTVAVAVGLTYLIVTANLAGFFVIRALARERATAVDLALGAPRWVVVRRLLSEALVPVAAAGVLGTTVALGTRRVVINVLPGMVGLRDQWEPSLLPLAAAWVVALLAAVAFTLAPLVLARRIDIRGVLTESSATATDSRRAVLLREGLVALQLGFAVTLAVGAGVVTRSVLFIEATPVGYPAREILVAEAPVAGTGYEDAAQLGPFTDALLQALRLLHGVEGTAVFSNTRTRMGLSVGEAPVTVEGQLEDLPYEAYPIESTDVTPGFFNVVGLDVVAGREFQVRDRLADVAIVNQTAARRLWPGRSPLGTRIKLGSLQSPRPWLTIVGVVEDSYPLEHAGLFVALQSSGAWPLMFRPLSHAQPETLMIAVRAAAPDHQSLKQAIRGEIARLAPALRVERVRTLHESFFDEGTNEGRVRSVQRFVLAFSVAGLLIAALGIGSVLAYAIRVRQREIGLRIALGATHGRIAALVLQSTGRIAGAGLAVGACLTAAGSVIMADRVRAFLYGNTGWLPVLMVALSVGVVVGCACLAALVPAWQAVRTDPLEALRSEG